MPLVAVPTALTLRVSPVSGAKLSLLSVLTTVAPESSASVTLSLTASGLSLTLVTVMFTVAVSVTPPEVTV